MTVSTNVIAFNQPEFFVGEVVKIEESNTGVGSLILKILCKETKKRLNIASELVSIALTEAEKTFKIKEAVRIEACLKFENSGQPDAFIGNAESLT